MNSTLTGTAPQGDYTGISFEVGVPFELNHADPTLAAPPMNLTSMFWNWRAGYRFMRVDLVTASPASTSGESPAANSTIKTNAKHAASQHKEMKSHGQKSGHSQGRGWSMHVGSTGCDAPSATSIPTGCTSPNRISVSFDDFTIENQVLVIDPANLLTASDVTQNTTDTPPGCMSSPTDPECNSILDDLGLRGSSAIQQLIKVR